MSPDDRLEVAGNVWGSLSTGKKWGVAAVAITLLGGTFLGGYRLASILAENRIAELRAKYERRITELQGAQSEGDFVVELSLKAPDEGLPMYSEAKQNDATMMDVAGQYADFQEKTRNQTRIQKPSFFETYKGQRFTWSGYVSDVYQSSFDDEPYFSVRFRPKLNETYYFPRTAFFVGDAYEEMVKGLSPDQEITVSGVMNLDGDLTRCKFVRIGDPVTIPE